MKTALTFAAILAAFALAGTIDYNTAAGLAAEHSNPIMTAAAGGHHVR